MLFSDSFPDCIGLNPTDYSPASENSDNKNFTLKFYKSDHTLLFFLNIINNEYLIFKNSFSLLSTLNTVYQTVRSISYLDRDTSFEILPLYITTMDLSKV